MTFVRFRGQSVGFWPGPRVFYMGGRMRRLVALSGLGTLAYAGYLYYPTGYVGLTQPMCVGRTDDGCTLQWQDVPTEDGSTIPQCVQFCARDGGQPPPVRVVQEPPPPTGNDGACEVHAFTEPNLQGDTFTTSDNYPTMGEWSRQISSLQITAGVWDFFTDENYGGEAVRLEPGDYPTMPPEWVNQISSFMCAQPGAPPPGGQTGNAPPGPPPPGEPPGGPAQ